MSRVASKGNGKRGKRSGGAPPGGPVVSRPLVIGAGLIFAVIFAGFIAFTGSKPPGPGSSAIGGPFQLTSHTGGEVSDRDLLGKPFLVFFGYTNCPDICHTTLFEISEVLRALGPDAKVGALFVTVDPERDTPPVLKEYLSNFDPRIIGVTGPRAQLDPMLREYKIFSKRAPAKDGDYSVDHTSVVYLLDKNGRFVSTFNVARKPAEAARDLGRYF